MWLGVPTNRGPGQQSCGKYGKKGTHPSFDRNTTQTSRSNNSFKTISTSGSGHIVIN
jgi:hypothetical protein